MMWLPLRIFLFCFFLPFVSFAEPVYLHYTVDEGLPSNEVYDVYEDQEGYIWFATDHGISRFDGYTFRNYSTNEGLVHNTVFGFHEDRQGRVWMRTFNSSLCYIEHDSIHPWKHNEKLRAFLGRDFIQRFAFDKAGNLWFVSIRKTLGLLFQDAKTGAIKQVKLHRGYNAFIRELDSGELIGGMDLQNAYAAGTQKDDSVLYADHTWLFRMPKPQSSRSLALFCFLRTGPASFIFTYDSQLLTLENGRVTWRREFPELIRKCYADHENTTWLCVDGALPFQKDSVDLPLLKGRLVTSMLQDRMGNYWFTTNDKGVFMARNTRLSVLDHFGNKDAGELLDLDVSKNSLLLLNRTGEVFEMKVPGAKTPGMISAEPVISNEGLSHCMYFCRNRGQLLLSGSAYTQGAGGWQQKNFLYRSIYPAAGVREYAQTNDSLLVAGNSCWLITDSSGKVIYCSLQENFSSFCTAIAGDAEKGIWIGTTDGLYTFSKHKTIPFEPGNPVFRQRVTDIKFGPAGEIFVSTRGVGLLVIDGEKRYALRMRDGLSSDQCANICVDDSLLWVCSNNGLDKITLRRKNGKLSFRIEQITMQHGLSSNMVNDAVREGDFLFLATGKGLNWFNVHDFQPGTMAPPVYIHTFLSNNVRRDPEKNPLSWKDNTISIGFTALLYSSPAQVHYRYRLEGYEQEWNYTSDRVARYFNLPPGTYTFLVSAMNENGAWNLHPAVVHFYIPAHFTQTAWFRILVLVLFALLTSGIVFYFARQQRDKARSVLALSQAEQKALRSQMKPHFIFNSLNSIQNFIVSNDNDAAHLYLADFALLMRRVLEQSQYATIALEEELETLRLYLGLEKLRFGKTFSYSIETAENLPLHELSIPPLFLQPYVENAIWHGLQLQKNAPRLRIHFSLQSKRLVVLIEDNGIGRKRSGELQQKQARISMGMKNAAERITILNAGSREKISIEVLDLTDEQGNATGTRVVLHFPLSKK